MNKSLNRKKIISILFISAVGILLLNLLLDKFFFSNRQAEVTELSAVEIDSVFKSALFNLGVHEDWIKNKKVNLTINIPKDLPAVLILQEMNNLFDTSEVKIRSVEKKIGGSTTLTFISGDEEKLKAELIYSNKVKRKSVRIGFIVERLESEIETDSLLLRYPEQFALLLVPSDNSAELVKKILENDKEYIIYLNDDINELKYKLSEDYSESRLKNSIREIVGTFPGAVFFMSDPQSLLYTSKVYKLLQDELKKRKIKLYEKNIFAAINAAEGENLSEIFDKYLSDTTGGEDKIIITSAENFLLLNSGIIKYRKLGYKFTNPSALID